MTLHADDVEAIERIIARARNPKRAAQEIAKWITCRFADNKDGSPFQKENCDHQNVEPFFADNALGKEIVTAVKCTDCNRAIHPADLGFTPEE